MMTEITVEQVTAATITALAQLSVELWSDSSLEEELANGKMILESEKETCYLVKMQNEYIAFIHVALRFDYVEGADDSPVAYIEGMYVKPSYRHVGIGRHLIQLGEEWGKQNKCKQLASDTELDNVAGIEFHMKSGFTESNRIVCFVKPL